MAPWAYAERLRRTVVLAAAFFREAAFLRVAAFRGALFRAAGFRAAFFPGVTRSGSTLPPVSRFHSS